jgi:hypothetical protein
MNFDTDEALLTGESLPVAKDANLVLVNDTGPGDRTSSSAPLLSSREVAEG